MEKHNDEIEIDLLEIIHILFRKFWLILGAGLFAAVICLRGKYADSGMYQQLWRDQ